jgi:hypothetical protein
MVADHPNRRKPQDFASISPAFSSACHFFCPNGHEGIRAGVIALQSVDSNQLDRSKESNFFRSA